MTNKDYFVRGSTALLDAIGKTILEVGQRLSVTEESKRAEKVIFVITTDGMENASREFTHEKIKDLIEHQRDKYSWEFIFLGANIDAAAEGENIGICRENTHSFVASKDGVGAMYCMVSEAVSERRSRKNKHKS